MESFDKYCSGDEVDFLGLLAATCGGEDVPEVLISTMAKQLSMAIPTIMGFSEKGLVCHTGPLIQKNEMLFAYATDAHYVEPDLPVCFVGGVSQPGMAAVPVDVFNGIKEHGINHPIQICDIAAKDIMSNGDIDERTIFALHSYLPGHLEIDKPHIANCIAEMAECGFAACYCMFRYGNKITTILVAAGSFLGEVCREVVANG
ncbi:MAG: hypothetical protein GY934_21985 [Gammaproteobacteria bacterium]|nr:hypothetical protein [Gammaproteobacteria bacterium]